MSIDFLSVIRDESARMAEILRTGPLDARVNGCPEWNLGELGVHMVGVQRWATNIVLTKQAGEPTDTPPSPSEAAAALEQSSSAIIEALSSADPQAACWNFTSSPHVMQFWFRRQANEIAIHRWDAEAAVSETPAPLDPVVAAHVIDEFLHVTMQRVIEREGIDLRALEGDVHVHCTDLGDLDAPGEWTFEIVDGALLVTDEHRKSTVAMRGAASTLALALYGRIDRAELEIFGDRDVLDRWSTIMTS